MLLKSEILRISELQSEIIRSGEKGLERDVLSKIKTLEKYALIITGIRRCGKSTLLSQMISKKYPDSFFLNFDDPRLYGFDYNDFNKLDEIIASSGRKILFFDELQSVKGWERYIRQKLDEKYKVVITGSNACLLSRELGTKLTGRYISKELFPFSFNEFIRYRSIKKDEKGMSEYLESGGFPEYVKTKKREILSTLFDDILIRDIVIRYGVRDIKSLQKLALYLISNIGNSVTGSKLKQAVGISATSTIMEYFSYLESAYLFYFVPRFSYSFKSQLINPRKIYTADPGLITVNSSSFSEDSGHKLENAVFNYLRLNCKELFYFQNKGECDFITAKRGRKPEAIQVCLKLDHDNLERELSGLFEALSELKIKNGIIVTFDQKDRFTDKGLTAHVIPAHEFFGK
jgi:predicted AAA+ superfamily ATPase